MVCAYDGYCRSRQQLKSTLFIRKNAISWYATEAFSMSIWKPFQSKIVQKKAKAKPGSLLGRHRPKDRPCSRFFRLGKVFKTARPVSICRRDQIDTLANRRWAFIIVRILNNAYPGTITERYKCIILLNASCPSPDDRVPGDKIDDDNYHYIFDYYDDDHTDFKISLPHKKSLKNLVQFSAM